MEKIKNYVIYLFKVNQINDLAMQEEITANLIEKYNHLLNEGLDEEKAYLETIKSVGNLNLKEKPIEQKFAYKPNWANISFYVALILGILGTVVLFVSTPISIILTAVSLALYVGASYYSYHLSQYVLKEERDILKHNELLRAMFGHLKTVFIFWNINISYWIAGTFTDSFIYHFILFDQQAILTNDIFGLFIGRLLISLVLFIIIFIIFKLLYNSLEAKYFELTKENKLNGILKDKGLFSLSNKANIIISKTFYIIITLIYAFIVSSSSHKIILSASGSYGVTIYYNLFEIPQQLNSFLGIIAIIAFILGFLSFIISLIKDNRVFKLTTFTFLLLSVIMMNVTLSSINTSLDYFTEFNNTIAITSIFAFLYIIYQLVLIIQTRKSKYIRIS